MSHRSSVPNYRRHKQSGQAIVTLTDGLGGRHDVLLGRYGTAASRHKYARVIAEWEAGGHQLPRPSAAGTLSVNELVLCYLKQHAEQHYRRPDGTHTNELDEIKRACRPLCHLYGHTPAGDFGPLALKAVRQLMVDGYDHPNYGQQAPLARGVVNQRTGRIRRLVKWAVGNELVPPSVLHGLQAVGGLQRGRTKARETEPIKPVSEAFVEATLPHLLPTVADMVRLQLLTGMRPGELVLLRTIDLDMRDKVWLFRPKAHKTAHHGHQRIVPIGPRAQEIIRRHLKPDLDAFLFSPREVLTARNTIRRANRTTPVQPSQQRRRKRRPRKAPGDRYTSSSYAHAIAAACAKAFPPPEHLRPRVLPDGTRETWLAYRDRVTDAEKAELAAWRKAHRWHPHQLRHSAATLFRRESNLDTTQAILGHRSANTTELDAEVNLAKAMQAMERLG